MLLPLLHRIALLFVPLLERFHLLLMLLLQLLPLSGVGGALLLLLMPGLHLRALRGMTRVEIRALPCVPRDKIRR